MVNMRRLSICRWWSDVALAHKPRENGSITNAMKPQAVKILLPSLLLSAEIFRLIQFATGGQLDAVPASVQLDAIGVVDEALPLEFLHCCK